MTFLEAVVKISNRPDLHLCTDPEEQSGIRNCICVYRDIIKDDVYVEEEFIGKEGYNFMTSKQDIKEWLEEGIKQKATHMLVVCDTYDYEDYPVYVKSSEQITEVMKRFTSENMQRIMEVYNLSLNLEQQLNTKRSWNID